MIIDPNVSVGALFFGANREDVESQFGMAALSWTDGEFSCYEYSDSELAAIYYRYDKLDSVIIAPNEQTSLYGKSIHKMPSKEIEALLSSHGYSASMRPRVHPAIRDKIELLDAGLVFNLEDGLCDDIIVFQRGSQ